LKGGGLSLKELIEGWCVIHLESDLFFPLPFFLLKGNFYLVKTPFKKTFGETGKIKTFYFIF